MQLKSKQRVADHGEVYTHEREVNAMLDLVADQAANPEKTFLEPACGTGNFLAEILRRKLHTVARKHRNDQTAYERTLVVAVGSIYGIELLPDNTEECRERLFGIVCEHYQNAFPQTFRPACLDSVRHILRLNIICGDTLNLKTAEGRDIVFAEWKPAYDNRIQRRDYVFARLLRQAEPEGEQPSLFAAVEEPKDRIPVPVGEYRPTHYLELGRV